jgi:hypothetical protein
MLTGVPHDAHARGSTQPPAQPIRHPNGAILPVTSSSDVFIPPRGRSFQKFSFDVIERARMRA